MRALLAAIGEEWYAVDVTAAREVAEDVVTEPLVTAPAWVVGVFNLRGAIVPLLDTGLLLGGAPVGAGRSTLIVDVGHSIAGLSLSSRPQSAVLGDLLSSTDGAATDGVYEVVEGPGGVRGAALLRPAALLADVGAMR
jgi:purine-binding chemotaxis protein CheW